MKKSVLALLCALLFVSVLLGGGYILHSRSEAAAEDAAADAAMQHWLDAQCVAGVKALCMELWQPELTPFEQRESVLGHCWDALTDGGDDLSFVRREQSEERRVYTVCVGTAAVCTATLSRAGEGWSWESCDAPAELFTLASHSLSVTVPEGSTLRLNGAEVGEEYLAETGLPYEDANEFEQGLAGCVRYGVPGLYENAEVTAERDGEELPLLRREDGALCYGLPADELYTLRITAPADAVVTVNGLALGREYEVARRPLELRAELPAELMPEGGLTLPEQAVYELRGLHALPEVTAAASDGTALSSSGSGESLSFALPQDESLRQVAEEKIRSFVTGLMNYGSGNAGPWDALQYVRPGADLSNFLYLASGSISYVSQTQVDIRSITSSDYVSLAENVFVCQARGECTTTTPHETRDVCVDYQLLFVRENGEWYIADMAYL